MTTVKLFVKNHYLNNDNGALSAFLLLLFLLVMGIMGLTSITHSNNISPVVVSAAAK